MTAETQTPQSDIPEDSFEARLMLARLHAGRLTIRQAAERCGYTNESWSGWERGRRPTDKVEVAQVVSEHLGVDRDWLLWGGQLAPETRRRRNRTDAADRAKHCSPSTADRPSKPRTDPRRILTHAGDPERVSAGTDRTPGRRPQIRHHLCDGATA